MGSVVLREEVSASPSRSRLSSSSLSVGTAFLDPGHQFCGGGPAELLRVHEVPLVRAGKVLGGSFLATWQNPGFPQNAYSA